MSAQTGQVLGGRYRLTDCIAVGGMGEVWRAHDDVLAREVAVKVLKSELARSEDFLTRFRHEARHSAALTHPNIAGVYDYGESEGSAYLVMELVPGEALNEILSREGRLPVRRAMDILAQTARGLAAAHAAGVVHRDVKPANLLVTPDGRVKITDFGIARAADQVPLTKTGQVMGTAQYLPPEQATGRPSTPASDIYSLGVVGYETLTGSLPFTAESPVAIAMAHINADPPPLPPSLPAGARSLIESAMAKDPADRPASALVFADAAQAVADGRDDVATQLVPLPPDAAVTEPTRVEPRRAAADVTPGVAGRTPGGRRRRRMTGPLWALVALLVFVVVGGVIASGVLDGVGNQPGPAPTPAPTSAGVTSATSAPPTRSTPPPATTAPAAPVSVDPGDYVGRDRGAVVAELRALGLRVTQQADDSSGEPADSVLSVSPSGDLSQGDRVTVVYSTGTGGQQTGTSSPTSTATGTPEPTPTASETGGDGSGGSGPGNAGAVPPTDGNGGRTDGDRADGGRANGGGANGGGANGGRADAGSANGGRGDDGEGQRNGEAVQARNNGGTTPVAAPAAERLRGVPDEMKDIW